MAIVNKHSLKLIVKVNKTLLTCEKNTYKLQLKYTKYL